MAAADGRTGEANKASIAVRSWVAEMPTQADLLDSICQLHPGYGGKTMGIKIAVVGYGVSGFETWTQAGHEVMVIPAPGGAHPVYSEEELGERCRDVDILVNGGRYQISDKVMERIPELRAIVVPFIGVDKIDVAAATARGILVVNTPSEELVVSVAEAAILLILALNKRLHHDENLLQAGRSGSPADRNDIFWGRTVGIVGFGRTGRAVAQRLRGWGVRLVAYDPYVGEVPEELQGLVTLVDLETLLAQSDFVTIHALLTEETFHMLGARELRMMKPTAYLVNTARGAIVDEEALADAIEQGVIAGAGIDTFEVEPLPMTSRLRQLDPERVILTPHNLPHSREALDANLRLFTHNVLELAAGRIPAQVVNTGAVPAWQQRLAVPIKP
jgi:phosphoglycerate dehydrogenase-like enzyme